ncbi:hypothetical protein E2562_015649 [Oryza meyeriana var. granulata]|uniref:Uncharacterized protein n=1 Tax=Oryza meyeriana var. granulata TaxID=110450 RepID=A0A6G1D404_9ORYZ|nr:hypothetical protein E2562_015649 [Oryza meyeriana var. granulata]
MKKTSVASGINEATLVVYMIVLYVATVAGSLGCRALGERVSADDLAALLSGGQVDVITCLTFAVLTLAMQTCLACVLEEKPAAAAPRRAAGWLPWLVAALS